MAVLVTRPHPDDETTAASLRARRFEVLRAPMLRFEPVAIHEDINARYSAVIVTSANALRSIESHLKGYRMIAVTSLPREVCDAFVANQVEAVLHYSQRSARAFLDAARAAGVEISALAIPQCCISAAVASVVRDAGATQVVVAATPDENALFEALERALRP